MEAKEKAKELIEKFKYCQMGFINPVAKQCALIAIDEMMQIEKKYSNFGSYEFLQEVKQEIQNL